MAIAGDTMQEAANYLNDFGLTNFTKEQLFALMMTCHREMQVELVLNGIPVIKEKSAVISIPVGNTDMGVDQPADLIEPVSCWERAVGSTDDFQIMIAKSWEPEEQKTESLRYWTWRGELILFLGATTAREVKLYYKGGIAVPTQEGDSLGFLFAENFLGPATAAKMAAILEDYPAAKWLADLADTNFEKLVRMGTNNQQNLPARRIPYRRRVRSYYVG
jgi:hypothetical protein